MRVVSLGDLTLDVVVRIAGSIARGADTPARVSLSAGGQGANVAAWVAALGGDAAWLGKRADDGAGRLASAELERRSVELLGPVEGDGGGIVVSIVDETRERSMFPDRGVATAFRPDDLRPEWLACDHLHVSGYALIEEPGASAAVCAVELARRQGARISVDLSSWSALRAAGAARMRDVVASLGPEVVFANEDEDREIGGRIGDAAWILKRGSDGCSFDGDERAALPVDDVVDTTGAGDALAAGYILGGPELALEAAARCVQQAGAMP